MATASTTNKCLRTYAPRVNPMGRLFCFTWAGAGAGAYRTWGDAFGADIEVSGICLAGREGRHAEPRALRMSELVDDVAPVIAACSDRPFAFFGHGLGALLAFEVSRRLRDLRKRLPRHLFVSGAAAPHLAPSRAPLHQLDDDALAEALQEFGGAPREFLTNPALMKLILPAIRADLTVQETYTCEPAARLNVHFTVIAGYDDPDLRIQDLTPWGRHCSVGAIEVLQFDGGEFYLLEQPQPLLEELDGALHVSLGP